MASGGLGGVATERWRGAGRVTHAGAFMAAAGALCPDRRWRGLDLGTIRVQWIMVVLSRLVGTRPWSLVVLRFVPGGCEWLRQFPVRQPDISSSYPLSAGGVGATGTNFK
jgi:hypothetical protein